MSLILKVFGAKPSTIYKGMLVINRGMFMNRTINAVMYLFDWLPASILFCIVEIKALHSRKLNRMCILLLASLKLQFLIKTSSNCPKIAPIILMRHPQVHGIIK